MGGMNRMGYSWQIRPFQVLWDVVAVVAYLVLVDVLVAADAIGGPLRLVIVTPLFVILPGYALLSLLFPAGAESSVDDRRRQLGGLGLRHGGLAWRERIVLSFGSSIALLPLFGFVVAAVGGFTPAIVVAVPTVFILACQVLGAVRRWRLPAERSYRVPVRSWLLALDTGIVNAPDRRMASLNGLLLIVVTGAIVGLGVAVAAPPAAETATDLSLLTTTGAGEYVESGYPSSFVAGEPQPLVAAVTNHEQERTDYTIVVEVHRTATAAPGSTNVLERQEVIRERNTVEPGETWHWEHEISTRMLGDELRLTYLLYRGPAPDSPSMESAYRTAYLWIEVSEPSEPVT